MKRKGLVVISVLVVLLLTAEGVARWGLGLGDPPLSVADPQIEYLFKPGRYERFGNTVYVNRHHMRSPEADRFPVLMIGDSVLNGGSQTDQSELASSLLSESLGVPVGNVSAGSWGPQNQLAYAERFGLFGAEQVVLMWNSGDTADVPTFEPIVGVAPAFPGTRPPSALWEGVTRYLPRYLKRQKTPAGPTPNPATPNPSDVPAPEALAAADELIRRARDAGADVLIALHLEREESEADHRPGYGVWQKLAADRGVPVVTLDLPPSAYRDKIHPNAEGQRLIYEQLRPVIRAALGASPARQDADGE
ncbi:MAG: hypothetical protein AAF800_01360 [Planctomycetota bacterium]